MRILLLFLAVLSFHFIKAQDDIQLDLDSIKNIKTTRYSSVNEVGVAINIGGKRIDKVQPTTLKTKLDMEKPSVMFRTVHGVLINPSIFIGSGLGIDFRPNPSGGTSNFNVTFPLFAEFREYALDGNFNIFFSERLGFAFNIDKQASRSGYNGSSKGAFGEFMIGGRYVVPGKKLAIHFGVGYRLQHLQRKTIFTDPSLPSTVIPNVREILIKHYIPVTIGVTF